MTTLCQLSISKGTRFCQKGDYGSSAFYPWRKSCHYSNIILWIKPLQIDTQSTSSELRLLAPNRFILDWVKSKFLQRICELVDNYLQINNAGQRLQVVVTTVSGQQQGFQHFSNDLPQQAALLSGNEETSTSESSHFHVKGDSISNGDCLNIVTPVRDYQVAHPKKTSNIVSNNIKNQKSIHIDGGLRHKSGLNPAFTFKSFVEGKSNQMGLAAAMQIAENPGGAYNPLFIYGGVGLGENPILCTQWAMT